MTLPFKIGSLMASTFVFNSGIVLVNSDTEQYLPCITKVQNLLAIDSDVIIIVYDMTKSGKSNNIGHWMDEANHHCPEQTIKMLVGNKMDLLEQLNTKPINPLDSITWKLLAQEKITNTQISCKTYEGIELFW